MIPRFSMRVNSGGPRSDRVSRPDGAGGHRRGRQAGRGGFTLIELLVVITIIGIILGFVLVASMEAANRANERATQTLITKLEGGMNDRLEALLETRPDYTGNTGGFDHLSFADIYASVTVGKTTTNATITAIGRAQVIAWVDYVKAEMPDVFFIQNSNPGHNDYVLNFAGNPVPGGTAPYNSLLPLGTSQFAYSTGIYGASYTAAAGIYKNISAGGITYNAKGFDGVDNDGDTFIDEIDEGILSTTDQLTFATALATTHKHTTARSEMLYALLVEGRGPLGSVFSRDDFTDKEVQDTDNDGLPEFIDAWGQPLQFYRWPLLFHSDIQRGQQMQETVTPPPQSVISWTLEPPYIDLVNSANSTFQVREQDPLDPNQQLMSLGWWSGAINTPSFSMNTGASYSGITNPAPSAAVQAFEYFFHRLTEPYPVAQKATNPPTLEYWDRSLGSYRRAFYSKFLIVSGGPDQLVGIFRYPDTSPPTSPTQLIANENNALPFSIGDFVDFTANAAIPSGTTSIIYNPTGDPTNPSSSDLIQGAQDDISNQNLTSTGNIGGSG